jgi:hypothetical protein
MKTILLLALLLPSLFAQAGSLAGPNPWENEPESLWLRDFSGSPRDQDIPLPADSAELDGIGTKESVLGLFDRWTLTAEAANGRSSQYAEMTRDCKGQIELDFALTPEQWEKPLVRKKYFARLDDLIDKVGETLIADYGDELKGEEKTNFLRALHALAWQETRWQHYIRYKNRFFVSLSGGLTQIARSGPAAQDLLNANFFRKRGFCSIGSSLYYGFLEYYFEYREARRLACNQDTEMDKLLGAYNSYSSGFSTCHDGLSNNPTYREYQIKAMEGLRKHYREKPWLIATVW